MRRVGNLLPTIIHFQGTLNGIGAGYIVDSIIDSDPFSPLKISSVMTTQLSKLRY